MQSHCFAVCMPMPLPGHWWGIQRFPCTWWWVNCCCVEFVMIFDGIVSLVVQFMPFFDFVFFNFPFFVFSLFFEFQNIPFFSLTVFVPLKRNQSILCLIFFLGGGTDADCFPCSFQFGLVTLMCDVIFVCRYRRLAIGSSSKGQHSGKQPLATRMS